MEKGTTMNSRAVLSGVAAFAFAGLVVMSSVERPGAQRAGSPTLAISVEEQKAVAIGWSAKKKHLGKDVYDENNEKIGVVNYLIIKPDRSISYAIIGTGAFLGTAKNDVAIPVGRFKEDKGRIVLAGATKDALKAVPKFE